MPDYKKSIIYRIVCKDLSITDCYVGSTTQFNTRKSQHKYSCNNPNTHGYNYKIYQFIRNNGGWDNWSIIMVEEFPCNNKLELLKKERIIIENLKPTLNKQIPSRTKEEADKQYRKDNKEKINEYYKNNKESILQQKKQYSLDNKEKIKEKIGCRICKCMVLKRQFKRHIKSTKHINNL